MDRHVLRELGVGILATGLVVVVPNSLAAVAVTEGTTEIVSVATDGALADGYSNSPSLSDDGRFIAFASEATTLVSGDTNGASDVFLRDRQVGTTVRVSVATDGTQADGWGARGPVRLSGDGRFVVFVSSAPSLGAIGSDTFVRDLQAGTTTRVVTGEPEALSADGAWLATGASLHDLVGSTSIPLPATIGHASLSQDGRYLAYEASGGPETDPDLCGNPIFGWSNCDDIFFYDRVADETTHVSLPPSGMNVDQYSSRDPVLTRGGDLLFFHSNESLVSGEDPGWFVWNRTSGTLGRAPGNSEGELGGVSADGRYLLLSNGVVGPGKSWLLHDRDTGSSVVAVLRNNGQEPSGWANQVTMTPDTGFISFQYRGSDLVAGTTNGVADVFLRDRHGVSAAGAQPDALIRQGASSWKGGGVYNSTGKGQTVKVLAGKGKFIFDLRFQNDGTLDDAYVLSCTCGKGLDTTFAHAGGWCTQTQGCATSVLAPGGEDADLRLTMTVKKGSSPRVRICRVTATSMNDASLTDTVRVKVVIP